MNAKELCKLSNSYKSSTINYLFFFFKHSLSLKAISTFKTFDALI